MKIELLRHATLILHCGGQQVLVDPMLSDAGAMDPVANAANDRRIPLVSFPFSSQELDTRLGQTAVCIVSHLHRDHWDGAARERLRKNLPIACQPQDAQTIRSQGFAVVTPIESTALWHGLSLTRTGACCREPACVPPWTPKVLERASPSPAMERSSRCDAGWDERPV
jgi:L-ascorbate metabolism protein UlaG (beta-lactamase superfamily)